jgi:hypothetical protein
MMVSKYVLPLPYILTRRASVDGYGIPTRPAALRRCCEARTTEGGTTVSVGAQAPLSASTTLSGFRGG